MTSKFLKTTAVFMAATVFVLADDKKAAAPGDATIYQFTVKDIDGQEVNLAKYKGEVLLVVNVASECGLTKDTYPALESIFQKYKGKGFKVLAFPANDFGAQEPGTDAEIKSFCAGHHVTFDMFSKISVKGDRQAPIYTFLTKHPDPAIAGDVQWNFQKYLIGRDGKVIAKVGPKTLPTDKSITDAIEKALSVPKP